MAGRIPQQFIDELLGRIDIVDVIDPYVPLRKAGKDYQARCPFHEEKTPSFTVSPAKQFYHCFGCGAHGTAITFLMEYEHLGFIEALEELAKRAGMELPRQQERQAEGPRSEGLDTIMEEAATFYRRQLRHHGDAPRAVEYLKGRGLSGEIAEAFAIGFAPPGWDNLIRALAPTPARLEQLVTTGMVVRKEQGRTYDRFRNRIMFPIRNRRGKVIAFGGRALGDDDKPKYLNSPESPLFHKGRELYGLYEARLALRRIEHLIIVEGYMDVVALAQHGIRNAVATLGTAVTEEHLKLLFRTCDDLIFCLDGDRAGREAAWKALDTALPMIEGGRRVRFMFLPDGEDPDSLVRKEGEEGFRKRLDKALPLSTFLLDTLTREVDFTSLDGRARLIELARPKLARATPLFRALLIEALAERIHMAPQALAERLDPAPTNIPGRRRPAAAAGQGKSPPSPVRTAILLLLHAPALARHVERPRELLELEEPGVKLLVELVELLQANPNLHCGAILEQWRERPEHRHLARLAGQTIETPEEGMEAEFLGALTLLRRRLLEQEFQALKRKEAEQGLSAQEKRRFAELLVEKARLRRS